MAPIKAKTIRELSYGNIQKKLKEQKEALNKLRIAKLTQGPGKAGEIKQVRKNIARCLTIAHKKQRDVVKKLYKNKKYQPKDLRVKKTRALRMALSSTEKKKQTVRQKKYAAYVEKRAYALKA
eukprot:UN02733